MKLKSFVLITLGLLIILISVVNKAQYNSTLSVESENYDTQHVYNVIQKSEADFNKSKLDISQQIYITCSKSVNKGGCYNFEFAKLTELNSMQYSIEVLRLLQTIDPDAKFCHLIGHAIGQAEASKTLTLWKNLLASTTYECTYGFIHGIVEEQGRRNPDFKIDAQLIQDVCSKVQAPHRTSAESACVHVLAHVILVQTKGNIDKALDICRDLKDFHYYDCAAGTFMENIMRFNLESLDMISFSKTINTRLENLEDICHSYSGLDTKACWQEMAHAYVVAHHYNPSLIFEACNKAQDEPSSMACALHSMDSILPQKKYDLVTIGGICSKNKFLSNFEKECYSRVVRYMTIFFAKTEGTEKVSDFCSRAPTDIRSSCFQALDDILKEINFA